MKNYNILLFLLLFPFIGISCFSDLCSNDVIKEIKSPDGNYKAITFIRDCGATTDFSPQASILKISKKFKNEHGNAFQGYKSKYIDIKWVGDKTLLIVHCSKSRWIQTENKKIHGFKIIEEFRQYISE